MVEHDVPNDQDSSASKRSENFCTVGFGHAKTSKKAPKLMNVYDGVVTVVRGSRTIRNETMPKVITPNMAE